MQRTIIVCMRALPNSHPAADAEAQWSTWVSTLPEASRRALVPGSDRETMYRELIVSGRVTFGAVLLELLGAVE